MDGPKMTFKRCQAKAKSTGQQCKRQVSRGKRVCRMHGGKSPSSPGSPYSKFFSPEELKWVEEIKKRYKEVAPLFIEPWQDDVLKDAIAARVQSYREGLESDQAIRLRREFRECLKILGMLNWKDTLEEVVRKTLEEASHE